jgi:prepilin-type N-terminal cleavage/methylation domain-containing protein
VKATLRSERGFTLPELLIATGLLLVVSSIVTNALLQMTNQQQTIWNRTEMHSGVRGATELLQQEVGQAGRISLPTADGTVTLTANIAGVSPCTVPVTATVSSTDGMFIGEWLTTLDGDNGETVAVTGIPTATTFTGCFTQNHTANTTKITALGGFATGIVSPTDANGSTPNKLKMYGDVNGDGNMVYIEYYCDNGDAGTDGTFNLYRNVMPYTTTAASKAANFPLNNSKILLSNVHPNPPDASGTARPCFSYQAAPTPIVVNGITYNFVLDVAVTLTVWTQSVDRITQTIQTETKALLNVSPRNVFFTWEFAGLNYNTRVQPQPASVTALLP